MNWRTARSSSIAIIKSLLRLLSTLLGFGRSLRFGEGHFGRPGSLLGGTNGRFNLLFNAFLAIFRVLGGSHLATLLFARHTGVEGALGLLLLLLLGGTLLVLLGVGELVVVLSETKTCDNSMLVNESQ